MLDEFEFKNEILSRYFSDPTAAHILDTMSEQELLKLLKYARILLASELLETLAKSEGYDSLSQEQKDFFDKLSIEVLSEGCTLQIPILAQLGLEKSQPFEFMEASMKDNKDKVYRDMIGFVENEYPTCGICGKPFSDDNPPNIRNSAILSRRKSKPTFTKPDAVLENHIGIVTEDGELALNIEKVPGLFVHEECDNKLQQYSTSFTKTIKKNLSRFTN